MKYLTLILFLAFTIVKLKSQSDKVVLTQIKSKDVQFTIPSVKGSTKYEPIKKDTFKIKYTQCIKGASNNPIFLIDGLSIVDSTCNSNLAELIPLTINNLNVISKIIYDYKGEIVGNGLISITTNDTTNLTIKKICKQINGWAVSHPLTRYQLNNKIIFDPDKIKVFNSMDTSLIITIDTIINNENLNGLVIIRTK